MRFHDRVYINVAFFAPRPYRESVRRQLDYAGIRHEHEEIVVGQVLLLALLVACAIMFGPVALGFSFWWVHAGIALGVLVLILFVHYLAIYFKAADRAKKAEAVLPDVLHIIASNLRAGSTPYNALRAVQRPEFDPLGEEIAHAARRASSSESFSSILLRIGGRINSDTLTRTLRLFTTSLRAGGHSATLLEELARDIIESKQLQREFVSSTKSYAMFILFMVVLGAPFLLTISVQFVEMIVDIAARSRITGGSQIGFGFSGQLPVTPEFLVSLSIVMLIGTGVLASVLHGVIKEGRAKEGLRFAPLVVIASIIMFFVARHVVSGFF